VYITQEKAFLINIVYTVTYKKDWRLLMMIIIPKLHQVSVDFVMLKNNYVRSEVSLV